MLLVSKCLYHTYGYCTVDGGISHGLCMYHKIAFFFRPCRVVLVRKYCSFLRTVQYLSCRDCILFTCISRPLCTVRSRLNPTGREFLQEVYEILFVFGTIFFGKGFLVHMYEYIVSLEESPSGLCYYRSEIVFLR